MPRHVMPRSMSTPSRPGNSSNPEGHADGPQGETRHPDAQRKRKRRKKAKTRKTRYAGVSPNHVAPSLRYHACMQYPCIVVCPCEPPPKVPSCSFSDRWWKHGPARTPQNRGGWRDKTSCHPHCRLVSSRLVLNYPKASQTCRAHSRIIFLRRSKIIIINHHRVLLFFFLVVVVSGVSILWWEARARCCCRGRC